MPHSVARSFDDSRPTFNLSLEGYDEIFEVDEELYLLYLRGGDFLSDNPDGEKDSFDALHYDVSENDEEVPPAASSNVAEEHFAGGASCGHSNALDGQFVG